jgi:uncharacterized membrane protein YedE/YeeE
MERLTALLAGLLFGAGVTVSGMINPLKVQNFLDLIGAWDPTLLMVMGGALAVTLTGYALILQQPRPLFAADFQLPSSSTIDARLILGAVIFGIGWGIAGFCPGPAIASLAFGMLPSFVFVATMALGMVAVRLTTRMMKPVADG